MAKKSERISTREFSKLSGLSVSQISTLLRNEKIKGVKESGKWMISRNQLDLKAVKEMAKNKKAAPSAIKSKKTLKAPGPGKKAAAKKQKASAPPAATVAAETVGKKTYSVAEFSAMTYLTDFGVMDWIKKGRLKGLQDKAGQWRIDAANLEVADIKRLLRD
jgi:hypothetical protein